MFTEDDWKPAKNILPDSKSGLRWTNRDFIPRDALEEVNHSIAQVMVAMMSRASAYIDDGYRKIVISLDGDEIAEFLIDDLAKGGGLEIIVRADDWADNDALEPSDGQ